MYGRRVLFLALLSVSFSLHAQEKEQIEINTALMMSTFKLQGTGRTPPNSTSMGTVFFLGKPSKSDPKVAHYVLVTAAHVLDDIAGDDATIILRKNESQGIFTRFPYTFKIRNHGIDLYVRHPSTDVAAMYFIMPIKDPFVLLDVSVLSNDSVLAHYEVHPGDELFCLGYPLGAEANDIGFPILRGGKIASYPIVPTRLVKSILFDFAVFPGNSGGPVYFSYETRRFGGAMQMPLPGNYMAGVVGLVTQLRFVSFPIPNGAFIPTMANVPIQLGVIVPAAFIEETFGMLPEK